VAASGRRVGPGRRSASRRCQEDAGPAKAKGEAAVPAGIPDNNYATSASFGRLGLQASANGDYGL
jgi:hypothetical protein